ncbi:MAG TPA: hypothetical protein VGO80_22610 [Solirubrobacteraceae bacterium]|nr:hypothetical protein [Solirubrobacteraceae bacterium]
MEVAALRHAVLPAAATIAVAFVAGTIAVGHPSAYRTFFAVALGLVLIVAGVSWPCVTALATLGLLCFLAMLRRILIESSGWSAIDPLLLVGPFVVAALLIRTYLLAGRRPDQDTLVSAVIALLALMLLQVFNPAGPSVIAGFGGLIFVAVPLLWFLVGREIADRAAIQLAAYGVIVVGVIAALYGLAQSEFGFPQWDANWIDVTHIASLDIGGDTLRGFAMLSNSAEYKQILAMATVAALAIGLHGKPVVLLTMPVLLTGLVLSGARSAIALALLGFILIIAVRARNGTMAVAVAMMGITLSLVALGTLSDSLGRVADESSNAAVARQAAGFASPFDSRASTLPGHIALVTNGFAEGVSHPLGSGTAAGNLASKRLSAQSRSSTEFDLTDVLLSLGVIGGVLYVFVIIVVLRRVVIGYRRSRDVLLLVSFGFLIVSFSGWLKGAHYAGASILWFFAGWATAKSRSESSW